MIIRDMSPADTDDVLALNERDVDVLGPLDADALAAAREEASAMHVAEIDGQVAGFTVLYGPDATYRSINYRWHRDRFTEFLYLDRVAVSPDFRRRGVAGALYDEAERLAEPYGRLLCEVNLQPPNEPSLAFHSRREFAELGTLTHPSGKVTVMLGKEVGGDQG